MRRFERRNDAFGARQTSAASQRLGVGARDVIRCAWIAQPGVLRADQRVIEAGGNRMRQRDLAVGVLQKIAVCAVQHARRSAAETRRVHPQFLAGAARFHADQLHALVADEGMKDADGVAAAADAGEDRVGQPAFPLQDLRRAPPSPITR